MGRKVLTGFLALALLIPTVAAASPAESDGGSPTATAEPLAGFESLAIDEDAATDRLGLVDPSTGIWHLRRQGGQVISFYFGNPGDYPFVGDWNCDGIDTPGLYRQSDGFVYLRNTNTQGNADITFFFGNPGDIPIVGDFNNDGCDTVSIYRPSEARFYIINKLGTNGGGLGAADFSFLFGNPGDKPFVGDFNGNGQDTIGLHRESTGLVYFRNTLTTGIADHQFIFGNPGDRLVAGDWGIVDGIDTPGLFRPSNTTFYLRYSNTQGIADESLVFGQPTYLPIAGRWGATDLVSPPSGSIDNPSSGAGAEKTEPGESGGSVSDTGVPPSDDGGGGEPLIFEEAGSAPVGSVIDPSAIAPPGPTLSAPEGPFADVDAPISLPSLWDMDEEVDGVFRPLWCPAKDETYPTWGTNCASQYVFSRSRAWLKYENLPYSVGQVGPMGCSGTLVALNVVLTAAHCVAGRSGPFWFMPDLYGPINNGKGNPGNIWNGTRTLYHAEFLKGGGRRAMFDYAFIVLNPDNLGRWPGDVYAPTRVYNLSATSQSLGKGYVRSNVQRHVYGYPGEGWWAGYGGGYNNSVLGTSFPWWCGSNDTWIYNFGSGYYTLGLGCQTNGGNSGGPIWQVVGGQRRLVSVVSTGAFVVSCSYHGIYCGPKNRFTGENVWGPPLLNTSGPYGYDDLWYLLYNRPDLNGAVCTGPCP